MSAPSSPKNSSRESPSPKDGRDRRRHRNEVSPPRLSVAQSAEDKLIVLSYGANNNYAKWREVMHDYLHIEFPLVAQVFSYKALIQSGTPVFERKFKIKYLLESEPICLKL